MNHKNAYLVFLVCTHLTSKGHWVTSDPRDGYAELEALLSAIHLHLGIIINRSPQAMLCKTSWPRGGILEPAGREQLPCAFRCLASVNKCRVSTALHNAL